MILRKKIKTTVIIVASALITSTQISCYKDNKESLYPSTICDTANITWGKDIQAIVNNSCATSGCHDASSAAGSYALHNYAGVKRIVDNTRFLSVIETGSMPKNASKLSKCSIDKVRRWINTGALEN